MYGLCRGQEVSGHKCNLRLLSSRRTRVERSLLMAANFIGFSVSLPLEYGIRVYTLFKNQQDFMLIAHTVSWTQPVATTLPNPFMYITCSGLYLKQLSLPYYCIYRQFTGFFFHILPLKIQNIIMLIKSRQ
jgi:hypothetical protein